MSKRVLEEGEDPYELIRKLRDVVESQKRALSQYKIICDGLQHQKDAAMQDLQQQKKNVEYLTRKISNERTLRSESNSKELPSLFSSFYKSNPLSPSRPLNMTISSNLTLGRTLPVHAKKDYTQFVPPIVNFKSRAEVGTLTTTISINNSTNSQMAYDTGKQMLGQHLAEDFMLIGPDLSEFRRLREQKRQQGQLIVQSFSYFNINKAYKAQKPQFLAEIARRAFPLGVLARKKMIQSVEELRWELQQDGEGRMSEDFFVVNLTGDFKVEREKQFLGKCNPFRALFAVCLRVNDFTWVRDERQYQRREQEIWLVEKVYAILTYYPFFEIYLRALAKISKLLGAGWNEAHGDQLLGRHFGRSFGEAQKNEGVKRLTAGMMAWKPDYNQACVVDGSWIGTLPNFGFSCQYAIARFACPIFFSSFAYEQMLLLITLLFLEKTLIFTSASQSAGTLCALFIASVISPFTYNQSLILNCDVQKMQPMVFGFPFTIIASLQRNNENTSSILAAFVTNNSERFKSKKQTDPLVLIDIDSNTILYDPELNSKLEQIVPDLGRGMREAYHAVNSANSKSFSFPKKMPVETSYRPRNFHQKNFEEKKKLLREYTQKLENNACKIPTYHYRYTHEKILKLLTEFIRSFSLGRECHQEVLGVPHERRLEVARDYLMPKHKQRIRLLEVVLASQLFADYLDELAYRRGE